VRIFDDVVERRGAGLGHSAERLFEDRGKPALFPGEGLLFISPPLILV
jgi:hypothetical protein